MNTVTAVSVLVVVALAGLNAADALMCYQGVPGVRVDKVPCAGSCVTVTSGSQVGVACYPRKMADGCVQSSGTKACFCNTDLCNTGKSSTSVESLLWNILIQSAVSKQVDTLTFEEKH